eukprot:gene845-140_t
MPRANAFFAGIHVVLDGGPKAGNKKAKRTVLFEPWKHRKGTPERVEVLGKDCRSQEKDRDEQRASGISPEQDEVDNVLDGIEPMVERAEKKQEQLNDAKMKKHEEERGKAIEMRRRNLETFAETKTRNGENTPKKRILQLDQIHSST